MLSKRPWIISLVVIIALSAWLASGSIGDDAGKQDDATTEPVKEALLASVRVRTVKAEKVDRAIVLYGRTEPNRKITLKAETSGRVAEILAKRGASINQGDPILRIAMDDRESELIHARAQLAQHSLEYEGAKSLSSKGFQGKAQLAERKASLKETQARIARLERDMENTLIRAPFSGVLLDRHAETGDYLSIGDPIADIVDLDPIIVRGDLTQADVPHLHPGQPANIKLAHGKQQQGEVRYLASVSDSKTNTFRVEISAANPQYHIFGGLSAEIEIPLDEVMAIRISPALLALNDEGVIGVKWIKGELVHFTPIDVVKNDQHGTWIQGLGDEVQLITVGQAFVSEGDKVKVSIEEKQIKQKGG
jgi:multidrug efflux system membrane fusion protein